MSLLRAVAAEGQTEAKLAVGTHEGQSGSCLSWRTGASSPPRSCWHFAEATCPSRQAKGPSLFFPGRVFELDLSVPLLPSCHCGITARRVARDAYASPQLCWRGWFCHMLPQ